MDKHQRTPLHYAAYCGHLGAMKWLHSNFNILPGFIDESDATTALHYAAISGCWDAVEWLIVTFGLDPQKPDRNENTATALYFASNPTADNDCLNRALATFYLNTLPTKQGGVLLLNQRKRVIELLPHLFALLEERKDLALSRAAFSVDQKREPDNALSVVFHDKKNT